MRLALAVAARESREPVPDKEVDVTSSKKAGSSGPSKSLKDGPGTAVFCSLSIAIELERALPRIVL